jgi:hypothetical protein
MPEVSDSELENLRDCERAYDEICEAVVGAKMIPPLPIILQWKRDHEALQEILGALGSLLEDSRNHNAALDVYLRYKHPR